ncbi:piggyBac transposable element-derived protein 4-like [Cebidichthys violaceus]|uniref:piggyBac transposable element-derived protein 4-like n=1 Tax=Cebidichthys violaceus TaxID=271503 RepID=UPI0035CB7164
MMAKRTKEAIPAFQEKLVKCTERESDESLDELSDEESHVSAIDSEAEAPFLQEGYNGDLSEGGRWNDADDADITPPQPTFRPTRSPGPQLLRGATYTSLQLFQLFFTNSTLQTIIRNTNDCGSAHSTASDPWVDLTLQDMFSFMSLVVYMGVVKCSALTDYWRGGELYGLPFPRRVMTRARFLRICRALRLSSPAADAANEQKRGTAAFDPLCKIKPLYQEMRDACIRNYHPSQEIAIEEQMVASKAHIGLKQYMKNKPVRWGFKLFVLADSRSRFTWDFFVYQGKFQGNSGQGLGYDSVMELIDTRLLGTGYKLFIDHFYTSPALFRDLLQRGIWACGTVRANIVGFPKTKNNGLDSKSPRGSTRWIRRDSVLFIRWRDTRDVFMCSTIHTAHAEDAVQRRVKGEDGHWLLKDVSVPPAVKEYSLCVGGVDVSDAQTGSHKVPHKTQKWYKMFFYQFMDIAIVNAFLLHKDIAKSKGETPLRQKAFRENLVEELAAAAAAGGSPSTARRAPPLPPPPPSPSGAHHRPVHIKGHSTTGRLKCRQCHAKTPVKCSSCDVPLCFVPGRDCYNDWHVSKSL